MCGKGYIFSSVSDFSNILDLGTCSLQLAFNLDQYDNTTFLTLFTSVSCAEHVMWNAFQENANLVMQMN